jgi:hypothetical protein
MKERTITSTAATLTVTLTDMTRLPEVVAYASRREITLEAAIVALINSGLSHA